jgi:hypothetical protein
MRVLLNIGLFLLPNLAFAIGPLTANRNPIFTNAAPEVELSREGAACPLFFSAISLDPSERMIAVQEIKKRHPLLTPAAASIGVHGAIGGAAMGASLMAARTEQQAKEQERTKRLEENEAAKPMAEAKEKPLPKIELPTRAELIAQAQSALREWKKTGRIPIEMGKFFLQSEMVDDPSRIDENAADTLDLHKDMLAQASASGSMDKLIKALEPYTRQYCSDYAMLSDYYRTGCGNCESATKIYLAAILDGKVPVPEGKELGVQLFSDHVQAVLVDKASKQVFSFVDGKTVAQAKAPVYQPAAMLEGYLRGKGLSSGVAEKDLMILDADVAKGGNLNDPTNTELKLDFKSGAAYSDRKPPKFSLQAGGSSSDSGIRSEYDPFVGMKASVANPMQRKQYVDQLGVNGFAFDPMRNAIIFEKHSDLAQWSQLRNSAEAKEFLLGKMTLNLPMLFQSPGIKKLRELTANPAGFNEITEKDLLGIYRDLGRIDAYNAGRSSFLTYGAPAPYSHPGYRLIERDMKRLAKVFNQEPEKWLREIDRIPVEQRALMLRLMAYPFKEKGLADPLENIRRLVTKEKKVDTLRPFSASDLGNIESMIDIDYSSGSPKGTYYRKGDLAEVVNNTDAKGTAKEEIPIARPGASIEIAPTTMAGILLSSSNFDPAVKKELWSTALNDAREKYFATPEFDLTYGAHFLQPDNLANFTKPETRARYRNLKFVKISIAHADSKITYIPPPGYSYLTTTANTIFQGSDIPSVMPEEYAIAMKGVLDRQYPGKITFSITPMNQSEALEILSKPPPKPFNPYPSATTDTAYGVIMGGFTANQ